MNVNSNKRYSAHEVLTASPVCNISPTDLAVSHRKSELKLPRYVSEPVTANVIGKRLEHSRATVLSPTMRGLLESLPGPMQNEYTAAFVWSSLWMEGSGEQSLTTS